MDRLFESFLREKEFLVNVSPRTLKYYRWTLEIWKKRIGQMPTKANLKEFVIQLQQSGISTSTTNSYIRGMNSFFTWLYENEHTPEKLRIKPLKEPQKVLKVFSDEQIKRLLSYKAKTFAQHRFYSLLCFVLDTGVRIDEALSLERSKLDMENLLVTVRGKGNKERTIPINLECRKLLFKFLKRHQFDLVFPTREGSKVSYRNALDQFKDTCKALHITGVRTSWHTLRHHYALNHIRQGGDVFSSQRMLGHTSLEVTRIYVNLGTEDLSLIHRKTSILSRLR